MRRQMIATLVMAGAAMGPAKIAQAEDLQPVTIAVGTSVLNIGYPWLTIPLALGYWEEEGYDVEVLPAGGSLQAMQQMVARNADFAQVNSSVIMQAAIVNEFPVRLVMGNGTIDWAVSVLTDSGIESPADLKGKTIGLFSLATGGIYFLRSLLQEYGVDPQDDVEMIAVGFGAAPVQALRRGDVDALMFWASATAGFENAGLEIDRLVGEDWASYPDYSLSTMQYTIDSDPEMIVSIARGAAKATLFAFTNPDCARRVHWANFPDTVPTGAPDDETLVNWEMRYLGAQLDSMRAAFKLHGGEHYGGIDPAAYDRLQEFMLGYDLLPATMPTEEILTEIPDFIERVNDFDKEAIIAAAEACEIE
jgi:NitT/TauT family transport system substrate-binding protein